MWLWFFFVPYQKYIGFRLQAMAEQKARSCLGGGFKLARKSKSKYKKKLLKQGGRRGKGAAAADKSDESDEEESSDDECQGGPDEESGEHWAKTETQSASAQALAGPSSQSEDFFKEDVFLSRSSKSALARTEEPFEAVPSQPAIEFSDPLVVFVKGVRNQTVPGLLAVGGFIGSGHPANLSQTASVFQSPVQCILYVYLHVQNLD